MASSNSSTSSNPAPAPKILLAKPGLVNSGKFNRGGPDKDSAALRARLPSIGFLNLLSDTWDFQINRFLPFLTDNAEFTVVGVIGPPGVGKSTILNEICGFDSSSPELIRPDGSSTVSVISGESLSAELAHEMTSIQFGILLASICHIIIVVSEGVHDTGMWRLMLTVDLLKHGIPDPSSMMLSHPQSFSTSSNEENINKLLEGGAEYNAAPIFVHTRLRDRDITPRKYLQIKRALAQCFSSSFIRSEGQDASKDARSSAILFEGVNDSDFNMKLFLVPSKGKDDSSRPQYESYISVPWKLRDQVLSANGPSFSRTVSERDWLKNSAKIWEFIKNSPTL